MRRLGLGRVQPVLLVVGVVAVLVWIGVRERHSAGARDTRASILHARGAVDRYLADHEGGCPQSLNDLVTQGYVKQIPRDAWGRPLRLVCPGKHESSAYELMSDGADGLPGGLDRIE